MTNLISTTEDSTQISFTGYQRGDRPVGIRNRVLILPSVICSQIVAERIAAAVPRAVSASHDHGCGQIGADNDQTERTLIGVAANPNVAGTQVVGLGCEHVQSKELKVDISKQNVPVRELSIQDVGGVEPTIDAGIKSATEMYSKTTETQITASLGNITLGIICSDLQPGSLSTAEPLLGSIVDTVVEAGGRVLFANTERMQAHPDQTRKAAATTDVADKIDEVIEQRESLPSTAARIRNKAASHDFATLTNTWGSQSVQDILTYGEQPTNTTGFTLVDAPSQFTEAATALTASGAQVLIHVTDDGVPTGHPIAPVIKITGNESTYQCLSSDIDLNAAETTPKALHEYVAAVLDGQRTCAEKHGVYDFGITRIGPSM